MTGLLMDEYSICSSNSQFSHLWVKIKKTMTTPMSMFLYVFLFFCYFCYLYYILWFLLWLLYY